MRGARAGAAAQAEEDAACYLECELLLYGSAGAYAVARARLLAWRQNDRAVRQIQAATPTLILTLTLTTTLTTNLTLNLTLTLNLPLTRPPRRGASAGRSAPSGGR